LSWVWWLGKWVTVYLNDSAVRKLESVRKRMERELRRDVSFCEVVKSLILEGLDKCGEGECEEHGSNGGHG